MENKATTLNLLNDFYYNIQECLGLYVNFEALSNSINIEKIAGVQKEALINYSTEIRKIIKLTHIQFKALFDYKRYPDIKNIIERNSFNSIILEPCDVEDYIQKMMNILVENKVEKILVNNKDIINTMFAGDDNVSEN